MINASEAEVWISVDIWHPQRDMTQLLIVTTSLVDQTDKDQGRGKKEGVGKKEGKKEGEREGRGGKFC